MELILWRHAEAEDGRPDAKRKLTPKGLSDAKLTAAWLKKHLPSEYRLLVSPATRTQQTARTLSATFETREELGSEASPSSILRCVDWPKGKEVVVVVGHQPTLGQLVCRLLCARQGEFSIKKSAVWWLVSRERDSVNVVLKAVIAPELFEQG